MKKNTLPQHLLNIQSLNRSQIETILHRADYFLKNFVNKNRVGNALKGKIVANLFFEPSTRTCNSFEVAAYRLGGFSLTPNLENSSLTKGETIKDTVLSISAIGAQVFVIRHKENGLLQQLAAEIPQVRFISAGEGTQSHPTQTLLDLLTIQQHKKSWKNIQVSIIGDIAHSRVAQPLIDVLSLMGIPEIHLIGPQDFLPTKKYPSSVKTFHTLAEGLPGSDVVMTLRLQKERISGHKMSDTDFHQQFGLTSEKLALAKPNAIVMHPGPINRGIEISSDVADGPQSVILNQVQNGIAVRMAVLDLFTT